MLRISLVVFGLWMGVFGGAQAAALSPFPSSILHDESQQQGNYRLVLSALTKTQSAEHEVRLQGQLRRHVWGVESSFTMQEVTDYFSTQLEGMRTLYECKALDCGSNNFWANNIFGNARLVGRDKYQYYRVALKQEAQQSTLYVLYIIQRGTKQIMVNLDVLSSPQRFNLELNSSHYLRQQLKSNSGWLAGFETENLQLHPERSALLLQALRELSAPDKSKLYLAVHCYSGDSFVRAQECSDILAEQLKKELGKEFVIQGQGAWVASPDGKIPALRFIYWPTR